MKRQGMFEIPFEKYIQSRKYVHTQHRGGDDTNQASSAIITLSLSNNNNEKVALIIDFRLIFSPGVSELTFVYNGKKLSYTISLDK